MTSTTGSTSRAKSMAAVQKLLEKNDRVYHRICPEELQAKVDRIALWSDWRASRAEAASWKAEPSRPRPPCQTSTRPPFKPNGNGHSRALTKSILEGLTRPPFKPIGNRHSRDLTESTLEYLARKPFPPLREYPSLGDFAAARAKGPEALRQLTERAQRLIREAVIAAHRNFPSPSDFAAAQAKGPEAQRQLSENALRLIREAVTAVRLIKKEVRPARL